jgi:DNA-binding transcriptional MerR regulator
MEELLTLQETTKILKVHPNTLRDWDKKGILIAMRISIKCALGYRKVDLEKFINGKKN